MLWSKDELALSNQSLTYSLQDGSSSAAGDPGVYNFGSMSGDWSSWLARWTDAGLIDPAAADRIRAFEQRHAGSTKLRWPILVALGFGALMLGGGVLLFVAAHWDGLSPAQRFAIVILLVGGFHVAGAAVGDRFAGMASALHAVGTGALGGGIALAGQIFNLEEHWPLGVLLWALGAGVGWAVLRQTPQMILFAVLAPAWLGAEWMTVFDETLTGHAARVLACGMCLLALTYFTATGSGRADNRRRALMWLGAIALLPAALWLAYVGSSGELRFHSAEAETSSLTLVVGWSVAIGLPLALVFALRRMDAWPSLVALCWVLTAAWLRLFAGSIALYAWWAIGAIGLVAWGVRDGRSERVNMGAVVFAATVMAFYFSQVMDKLGRSASLVGLGVLFLAGGWGLERIRRRLVQQARATP